MKTIGIVGGMTWESTVEYYRLLNQGVKVRLGGFHSAKMLMYNVDFAVIQDMQVKGEWEEAGVYLGEIAQFLERSGADFVMLACNTMYKVYPAIKERVSVPILHIADAVASEAVSKGLTKVGLLGTKFTMGQDFYKDWLASRGVSTLIPDERDQDIIHRVIMEELSMGVLKPESKAEYLRVIEGLRESGAQGVILGCTEIPLLIHQEDVDIPVLDSLRLHAEAAVEMALAHG